MTLVHFFDRLLSKVETTEGISVDRGPHGQWFPHDRQTVTDGLKFLREWAGDFEAGRAIDRRLVRTYWLVVLEKTRDTNLFDEFKGNVELRRLLKTFVRS